MAKKDIKSTKKEEKGIQVPMLPGWKNEMRNAVNVGMKIDPINEEQTEYLNKCIKDKEEKDAKIAAREKEKQELLAKASEEMKKKKEELLKVANDLADRILCVAIAREEQKKKFESIDKTIKEKVDKELKEKAKAKREAKASKLKTLLTNKTIPSPEAIKLNKSRQNFLSKAHAVKLEEITKRTKEWEEKWKVDKEKYEEIRKTRNERDMKLANKRLEMHKAKKNGTFKLKRTTKEERIEAIKAKKAEGLIGYNKEMQRQSSEIMADREGYAKRIAKRQELETQRISRILEHRQKRRDKLFAEKLKQQKITQLNLNRFLESEKKRLARKTEKSAMYLTKGGVETPKVKNKVKVDEVKAKEFIEKHNNRIDERVRFLIRIAHTDHPDMITDSVGAFVCKPDELSKRLKEAHNKHMKSEPDNYIGIYAYSGIGKDQVCIAEMINDKFLEFNGKSTSRKIKADAKAA